MITVLQSPELSNHSTCDNSLFFQINGDDYQIVSSSADTVDVLLLPSWTVNRQVRQDLQRQHPHRISIEIDFWHSKEDLIQQLDSYQYQANEFVITTTQDLDINNPHLIYCDWPFNRAKAHYSNFPWHPDSTPLSHGGMYSFVVTPLSEVEQKTRIFLSATRTAWENTPGDRPLTARKSLPPLLRTHYSELGWLGNITEEYPYDFLYPNMAFSHYDTAAWVDSQPKSDQLNYAWSRYNACPPHHTYFKDTFISIYVETIQSGTSLVVTEKTYDPLMQGHFVLPFSNAHFVQYLRNIGIRLPDFIDYSYDAIEDFDRRLAAWHAEIHRLLNINIDTWRQHWQHNLRSVLHANQLYFHRRDYDRVDLQALLYKF